MWLARLTGGLALIFFLVFYLGDSIYDLTHGIPPELRSVLLLLLFATFAYIFAWFREKEGGITLSIAGAILGLNIFYKGGMNDLYTALVYSLPLLIPGLMFWYVGDNEDEKS